MTDKTQPEALELHEELWFAGNRPRTLDEELDSWSKSAEHIIRRQHAEIQQLKAAAQAIAELLPDMLIPDSKDWQDGDINQRVQFLLTMREANQQYCADLEAQLSARQAAPDGWRLVPMEPTEEMLDAAHEGDREYTLRVFGDVMTVMQGPHDHYVAMLSAAPPPPEREPKCWCETCRPITISDMRMVLCPDCGNKRCPKATHHDNACTSSNAPGQPGSSWEHVKPHGATND